MKRKRESPSASFSAVVLFREDLEELLRCLAPVSTDVSFSCGNFEFESLDELRTHRRSPVDALEFSAEPATAMGWVSVDIKPRAVSVDAHGEPDAVMNAFSSVAEFIRQRQLRLTRVLRPVPWFVAWFAAGMLTWGLGIWELGIPGGYSGLFKFVLVAWAGLTGMVGVALAVTWLVRSRIYLDRRHADARGVNWLAVTAVAAVITVALGVISVVFRGPVSVASPGGPPLLMARITESNFTLPLAARGKSPLMGMAP